MRGTGRGRARTTDLVSLACGLQPTALGPMLGLHPITAVQVDQCWSKM
ncbi:hypothetical protein NRK68_35520 (plasmid) [Streptomyces yangpuensis]|uniref:Uncharacterized protein n=1 Tax=Streptomyces yangpuensis TaxID=1648182 RepID=A0ABY5Q8M5_9ACTN|nr:hypothetical protein [Streptomyces yangpuensis]UUY52569.1 hypothetical protein NRK68_35520 [Streptomyces yangpuensis]